MPPFNRDRGDFKKKNFVRHNEGIRISPILVIHDGDNKGTMQTRDALALARSLGLDLVEVAPNVRPPVCHITDYGKYMFEKSKKEKEKPHVQKEKEVCFRYVTDDHDLETKANQIRGFLDKGMKVKLVVKFKAREKAHKDLGFDVLNKVITKLEDVSTVEMAPRFEGATVMAKIDRKKETKKDSKKESK